MQRRRRRRRHGTLSQADQGRRGYNEFDHRIDRAHPPIEAIVPKHLSKFESAGSHGYTRRGLIGEKNDFWADREVVSFRIFRDLFILLKLNIFIRSEYIRIR